MAIAAVTNFQQYAWSDWLLGVMRSFISGGAAALITGGGAAVLSIPGQTVWKLMAINFVFMGLYRLGEFLQLHGAPDKLQQALDQADAATKDAGAAIASAKASVPDEKK